VREGFLFRAFVCSALLPLAASSAATAADFDRDVRPILSTRCLRCHAAVGPEAGLDLTSSEKANAALESGNRAIVPGDPAASELLRRVSATDPDERMPPIGDPLTPAEVETLRGWIAEGAPWPPHWAYRPLRRPEAPVVTTSPEAEWARTPIDRFILKELRAHGLSPSGPADKRTWLRRVTFDLTGLPPTPEELAAFLADDSPEAFDKVADRLLASPHYGERWARHWMDLAHFAETHGHDQDRPRPNAWPYRDYLIRSFNEDTPYGRFVEEQVAGDVLFPGDPQAVVATGFLAAGPWDESSLRDIREDSLDREIARYIDRDDIVTSVMGTFASTTVQCARCHDHKFDPIAQADYYGLQAVFASTDKANRAYDPDPAVAARRADLLARKAALPAQRQSADPVLLEPALQAEVASWEREVAAADAAWVILDPETFTAEKGSILTEQPDHSLLAGGTRPETEVYVITAPVPLPRVTGLRIEVLTDASLPHTGPGRQDNGNLHLNELKVTAAPPDDPAATKPVTLRNPHADFDQAGWTVAMALDGNPATAWGIFPEVGKPHRATFEVAEPIPAGARLTVRLEQTHGGGHLIGRVRLAATAAPLPLPETAESLPAEVAAVLAVPADERSGAQRATLAAFSLDRKLDRELSLLPPQQLVYCGTNRFTADGSFRPAERPRAVYVLNRGDVRQPGELAKPAALACLPDLDGRFSVSDPDDEGARRAVLARWLSDPRNALVWRSIANRVWQSHFGRGLVDTPNDFGRMGATPTHPELLDWLAAELLESGGSLKRLHRRIVLSAVYRQSSSIGDFGLRIAESGEANPQSIDSDNRLLWRMNRTRLDAESVHDAILAVSGRLDAKMGGPSVKQFVETPGIHVTPNVDYRAFDIDDPVHRRRSVYRFLFRTLPDPFMETLDCPDGSQPTARRNESITALQALAMLNDRFVVRQSEHLAEQLEAERPDLRGRIRRLYELALLREPAADELAAFEEYATTHGLANAGRMLLNSNEFLFAD
jgi:hypothetical protein